jgi:ATP-dependent Clp protease protease subunit
MANRDLHLGQRAIFIDTDITDESATETIACLLYLNQVNPKTPIRLIIDSMGGTATGGMAIADTMSKIDGPIHTHCAQNAGGIALLVLTHGLKGQRTATRSSQFYFTPLTRHDANTEGNAGFAALRRDLVQLLAEDTGRTPEEILGYMDKSWKLNCIQALALGIIDRIEDG